MKTAKLFKNGRSQAVRLPKEFQFQGDQVRIRRLGRGVLLEPMEVDFAEIFRQIDELGDDPTFVRHEQPPMQERDFDFD